MKRPILKPGPNHPITISSHPRRVTVSAAGRPIVDTTRALILKEADYPPVTYVPRDDTDMSALQPTASSTYCPFKGEASYFNIDTGDDVLADAVWSYESPHDAVPEIAGFLAFYPDRVQVTEH